MDFERIEKNEKQYLINTIEFRESPISRALFLIEKVEG